MLITVDVRTLTLACATMLACVGRPLAGDEGTTSSAGNESDSGSTESDSTSESESTSEADSDDESTSSGTFVPEWDLSVDDPCDSFAQDCPEGEKCVPYSNDGGNVPNANKCVPVLGDQSAGEFCHWDGIVAATDDCDADSLCWDVMDVDGELLGICAPFCTGSADAPICPAGHSCIINSRSSINVCHQNCDPLTQDCNEGLGCFYAVSGFNCVFATMDIPEGEPCGFINDCAPGNFCADAANFPSCAGAACCASFCDLDLGPGQCAIVGTECVPFFEVDMAPPPYEDVGICILPG